MDRTDLSSLVTADAAECRKRAVARIDAARDQCEMEKVEAILSRAAAINASWWHRWRKHPPVTLEQAEESFNGDSDFITALQWAEIRRDRKVDKLDDVLRLCSASIDGRVHLSPFHCAVLGFAGAD